MIEIVIATRNEAKLKEILRIIGSKDIRFKSLLDFSGFPEIEENGKTFAENAIIKAWAVAKTTGMVALADDSGLEVDALGGEPGIYSARFGGDNLNDRERNILLLKKMERVPEERRNARFVCAVAIATPDGNVKVAEGFCNGEISFSPRGNSGFGYDPIFSIPSYNKTFAELGPEIKDKISHRAIALRKASEILKSIKKKKGTGYFFGGKFCA